MRSSHSNHDSLHDLDDNQHFSNLASANLHQSASTLRDRPHSIDMSLELERQLQLEEETPPPTSSLEPKDDDRRVSLDPVILTGIVANLRSSMDELTKERDVLVDTVSQAHTREAELKEALALVTERCASLEAEVAELKKKGQDDEEAISLLRSKVEESRRGLMRIQSESKRMSQISSLSIDGTRLPHFFGNTPPSAKRASFTPLTGSGATLFNSHRRTPSVSDPGASHFDGSPEPDAGQSSPNAQIITLPDDSSRNDELASKKGRRISGFFTLGSGQAQRLSPPSYTQPLQPDTHVHDALAAQIEALAKERDAARAELAKTRHDLMEAQDAREASEHCVNTLRQFISANEIGEGGHSMSGSSGIKLPPLPTDTKADAEEEAEARKSMSSWSLKLWRMDTSAPNASRSTGNESFTSNGTPNHAHNSSIDTTPQTATPPVSFTKKFGNIFAARTTSTTSTQSAHSTNITSPPLPHSQQQEPMFNGSDCSSIDESEPYSPAVEHPYRNLDVMVREASHGSTRSSVVYGAHPQPISTKDLEPTTTPLVGREAAATPATPTAV